MNSTLVVIKFYEDKEWIWPGEWIGKYDGDESKGVEGRESRNIFFYGGTGLILLCRKGSR